LRCGAVGLDQQQTNTTLRQLAGIIVNCPSQWSDTYCFNLREAILRTKLVQNPEQIFFVPDAIATLLATLPNDNQHPLQFPIRDTMQNVDWTGNTLIIAAGASVTEMSLVNLPPTSQVLTHYAFSNRSIPYAGLSLEQDILCHLIYPAFQSDADQLTNQLTNQLIDQLTAETIVDFALDAPIFERLHLEDLTLPNAGNGDLIDRLLLQRRLESSPEGQQLIDLLPQIKLKLQQKLSVTLRFGSETRSLQRQDLSSQVLLPYIQRLNREVNTLLSQTETTALSVKQVLCTGGSASFAAIARWLRQKFPNAIIQQDIYPFTADLQSDIKSCSRVAYGLATLPLHPQVLERDRHQYSDFFLLQQLLYSFPNQPVSLSQICEQLAQRGIATDQCETRIAALLNGFLPDGFAPDPALLTTDSLSPSQAVRIAPLFQKRPDQTFAPDRHQYNHFRYYLELLLRHSQQQLEQPLQNGLLQVERTEN
jgi:hypothetical protein